MGNKPITSKAYATKETIDDVVRLTNDALGGGSAVFERLKRFFSQNVSKRRASIWAHQTLSWADLANPPKSAKPADYFDIKPVSVDIALLKTQVDVEKWLSTFLYLPDQMGATHVSEKIWTGRAWDPDVKELIDRICKQLKVDLPALAKAFLGFAVSGKSEDGEFIEALARLDFTTAANKAQIQHEATLMGVQSIAIGFRMQVTARFLAAWNLYTRRTVAGGGLTMIFPAAFSANDIRAETLNKILDFLGFNSERRLRRGLDIPIDGSSGVKQNGKHTKSIMDLHDASFQRLVGTESEADKTRARLRPKGKALLRLLRRIMSGLLHIRHLREEAVLLTLTEANAAKKFRDVGAISNFRSWNGGLTHRALLLAIIVESTRFAEYFSTCPSRWSALSMLTDFNGSPGLPFRSGPLHQAVPCLDYTSGVGWNTAAEILEMLGPLCGLPAMDHGGLANDILLGRRFLRFVYAEADWFAELPNPETNAVDYRGHHWMALYQRFGMLGHLLR